MIIFDLGKPCLEPLMLFFFGLIALGNYSFSVGFQLLIHLIYTEFVLSSDVQSYSGCERLLTDQ